MKKIKVPPSFMRNETPVPDAEIFGPRQTTEEVTVTPSTTVVNSSQSLYVLGKRYAPKTERNQDTWARITAALKSGPKSLSELAKAVPDHKDFVGYMVRGAHLIPQPIHELLTRADP